MLRKIPFACQIERLTVHFGRDGTFFENSVSLPNLEYPDYNALHKSLFCLFFFYSTCGKTKKVVSWSFKIRNPISKNVTWQHEPYYDSHKQITSLSPFNDSVYQCYVWRGYFYLLILLNCWDICEYLFAGIV